MHQFIMIFPLSGQVYIDHYWCLSPLQCLGKLNGPEIFPFGGVVLHSSLQDHVIVKVFILILSASVPRKKELSTE